MVKFTQDLSDPQVVDLVVKKTIDGRYQRMARLFVMIEMVVPGLLCGYMWLRADRFSIIYPLVILLCLILGFSYKKRQTSELRESVRALESGKSIKPEYTVNEEGVYARKDHVEAFMNWSHFIGWKIQDKILYFETNDNKLIVCHQKQLSTEDFDQLKNLASKHIGMQK